MVAEHLNVITPTIRLHDVAKVRDFTAVIKVPNYLILSESKGDYPGWARSNQVSHLKKTGYWSRCSPECRQKLLCL